MRVRKVLTDTETWLLRLLAADVPRFSADQS